LISWGPHDADQLTNYLAKKRSLSPFESLLSLLDTLSLFNVKLAKPLGLSPHPDVPYHFQDQMHLSPTDEALWNVALPQSRLVVRQRGVRRTQYFSAELIAGAG
jgi:hypothetical protein